MKRIPYLTFEVQGQIHDENRRKSNQVIYMSGPAIHYDYMFPSNDQARQKEMRLMTGNHK